MIKTELFECLMRSEYTDFVTLEFYRLDAGSYLFFGNEKHHAIAEKVIERWEKHINRRFLGSRWSKKLERGQGVPWTYEALAEKCPKTKHLHYHLLMNIPEAYREIFNARAAGEWRRCMGGSPFKPDSTFDVRPITDKAGAVEYVLKDLPDEYTKENSKIFELSLYRG